MHLLCPFHFDGRPYMRCYVVTLHTPVLAGLPTWHNITLRNNTPRNITNVRFGCYARPKNWFTGYSWVYIHYIVDTLLMPSHYARPKNWFRKKSRAI